MKGSRNRRAWRHNHTGTLHLLSSLHQITSVTLPLLKAPSPPPAEAWDSVPSIQFWTLLLWFAALSLSSSICPPPSFEILSSLTVISFLCWSLLLFQTSKDWGTPNLKFISLSLNIHSPWRYHWNARLWVPSHTNDDQIYIPALTSRIQTLPAEALPDISLLISTPNWKQPKPNSWFQNLSSHRLTHLRNSITTHPAA